ncbi:hypothetical protein A0H81_10118 [Grifola frondosa]|uniref:Uncharacterized protein n=1 Tax=Grifola frondosa TaxID=5627 RepID=A0A1C7M0B7_GRIFR|nr:hypothetical protein A0H81_10118 [Grifola frondosa]
MILPDDAPSSPAKLQAERTLRQEADDAIAPPPAYPGCQSYQRGSPTVYMEPSGSLLSPAPAALGRAEPAWRRFLKASGVAFLIWFIFVLFIRSILEWTRWDRHGDRWFLIDPVHQDVNDLFGWPRKDDGRIERCVKAINMWDHPSISLNLPLSADVLYLFSRGALSQGEVIILQGPPNANPNMIKVEVNVEYATIEAMQSATVCVLERSPGEKGIGLLTPAHWLPHNELKFLVTVEIPPSRDGSPLRIPAFETNLPSFAHIISDLKDKVVFDSLSLSSSDKPIVSERVDVHRANIKTSNNPIVGTFRASRSLSLITSNAQISANVSLYSDNDENNNNSSQLIMKTSNGPITSSINLISTTMDESGGDFEVTAQTHNSYLTIDFPKTPLNSFLKLDAETSNSPATVHLNPAYEGGFKLETSNTAPTVHRDVKIADPSGRDRSRVFAMSQVKRVVKGEVTWSNGEDRDGKKMGEHPTVLIISICVPWISRSPTA